MAEVLRRRGEQPGELVVSVPISARRAATAGHLGNQTGVVPLRDPDTLRSGRPPEEHHGRVRRAAWSVSRGTSAGPMGLVFRALGCAGPLPGLHRPPAPGAHVRDQRPRPRGVGAFRRTSDFAGDPAAVTPGNVGVCFDVLSYAGGLVVTVVADPDIVAEQDQLTSLLAEEFADLLT